MMSAQLEMSSDRLTQEQQVALQERIAVVKERGPAEDGKPSGQRLRRI